MSCPWRPKGSSCRRASTTCGSSKPAGSTRATSTRWTFASLAGRGIRASDTADTPLVMRRQCQTMADHFWPGESPLGKRVRVRGQTWAEVVGVVADNKYNFITESPTDFVYLSRAQDPAVRGTLVVAAQRRRGRAGRSGPRGDRGRSTASCRSPSVRTMEEYYDANARGLSQHADTHRGHDGRGGPGARHGRALRARRLHGEPPDPGDRRPHGAWRAARGGARDGDETRARPGGDRSRRRDRDHVRRQRPAAIDLSQHPGHRRRPSTRPCCQRCFS